jgi:hypothetical protein
MNRFVVIECHLSHGSGSPGGERLATVNVTDGMNLGSAASIGGPIMQMINVAAIRNLRGSGAVLSS